MRHHQGIIGIRDGYLNASHCKTEVQSILEFEKAHDAGQESVAANDQLHGLDAHSVAISRQMRLQGLQRHV